VEYVNPKFSPSGISGPQLTKDQTVIQPKSNEDNTKSPAQAGLNLDDQTSAVPHLTQTKAADIKKISNLEIQFAFVVQDLYAKDVY
jgi:hypothetical protein